MEISYHRFPFCTMSIPEHGQVKEKLLELIDQENSINSNKHGVIISRTDWSLTTNSSKPYLKFITPYIVPHINNFFKGMGLFYANGIRITNSWFQQYNNHDQHAWHTHASVLWAAIYYVELPKDTNTIFKDFQTNKEFTLDTKEGDLIIFSASWPHRSPPNTSGQRKTVISFNIDEYILS